MKKRKIYLCLTAWLLTVAASAGKISAYAVETDYGAAEEVALVEAAEESETEPVLLEEIKSETVAVSEEGAALEDEAVFVMAAEGETEAVAVESEVELPAEPEAAVTEQGNTEDVPVIFSGETICADAGTELVLPEEEVSHMRLAGGLSDIQMGMERQEESVANAAEQEYLYLPEDAKSNPLHTDAGLAAGLDTQIQRTAEIPAAFSEEEEEYYLEEADAAAELRDGMIARNGGITIRIASKSSDYEALRRRLLESAVSEELSVSEVDGDYLRWHYGGYRVGGSYVLEDGLYFYTFPYTLTYYTTAEQEEELGTEIESRLDALGVRQASEYEKVREIHDFIATTVAYDEAGLTDAANVLQYTAYAALMNGTALCQGYSTLFYRMARRVGLSVRLIAGDGEGEEHSWNIVKIGEEYYNLDTAWDATDDPEDAETLRKYFLKSEEDFPGHIRYGQEDGEGYEYATDEFYQVYPMAEESYPPETEASERETEEQTESDETEERETEEQTRESETEEQTEPAGVKAEAEENDAGGPAAVQPQQQDFRQSTYAVQKRTEPVQLKLEASPHTFRSVRLSWNGISDADGYEIWRSNGGKTTYTCVAAFSTGRRETWTDWRATCGEVYAYKIRAYRLDGDAKVYSKFSPVQSAKTVPAAPQLKSAKSCGQGITVSWSAVAGADGYRLYRRTEDSSWKAIKTLDSLSFTDSTAEKGIPYTYTVRAYRKTGSGKIVWSGFADPEISGIRQ